MAGYKNLVKLSSLAYTEGFYTKPRVDRELLAKYSEGLIVSSACLAGEVAHQARWRATWRARARPPRGTPTSSRTATTSRCRRTTPRGRPSSTRRSSSSATSWACRSSRPTTRTSCATTDHDAHDVLLCIGLGKDYADQNRMHYDRGPLLQERSGDRSRASPTAPTCSRTRSGSPTRSGFAFEKKYYVPVVPAARRR